MAYSIPTQYFFRLHHVRPRFKNDVENVLIYVAEKIAELPEEPAEQFKESLNNAIYMYPGNSIRSVKTINNWRTEISSLFGFIEHDENYDRPGRTAVQLAHTQDLVQFFKTFLYSFQYPGAHVKSAAIKEQIEHGVHFKPAQYILKVLDYAKNKSYKNEKVYITKGEACHCIFNDLRCTRDNEDVSLTWKRITENREHAVRYDLSGDVIRYAGDIIDYMELANLLVTYDHMHYYLNTLESETVLKFINSTEWFSEYDDMIAHRKGYLEDINKCYDDWFRYVNRDLSATDFKTDIITYINSLPTTQSRAISETYEKCKKAEENINTTLQSNKSFDNTKEIGDIGECLVYGHECMRLVKSGRKDLVHLVNRIPTQFAVGYDIISVEADSELKRYIEVKTTISSKPLDFNKVHMTKNEWNTANTERNRYYIYRLMISKNYVKLFLLQNPVGLYKDDKIQMIPENGANISFDSNKVGKFEELLTWRN